MLIEGNTTNNNKGYGIYVPKPSHIIKDNSANDNGSWGIYVSEAQQRPQSTSTAAATAARATSARSTRSRCCRCSATCVQCAGGPPISADPVAAGHADPRGAGRPEHRRRRACSASPAPTTPATSRSSAGSTAPSAFAPVHVAADARRASRSACTPSRSARSTSPATSTRRPPTYTWTVGRAAVGRRAGDDDRVRAGPRRPCARARRSSSPPTSATRPSSAALDAAASRRAPGPAAPVLPHGGSITYTGLSVGTHTFQVRATDADGNADPTPGDLHLARSTPPPVADRGRLRRDRHAEHRAHERPDRLPRPRPDRRRQRHHDRPQRPRDRRHRARRRHPQQRLRLGHRHQRHIHEFDYGVQLNPGTSLNVVTGVRLENNQEAGIGLSDADQNGAGQHDPRQHDHRQQLRHRALQRHAAHAWCATTRSASTPTTRVHMESASQNLDRAQRDRPLRRRRRRHAGRRRATRSSTTLMIANPGGGIAVGEELIPSNNNLDRAQHDRGERRAGISVIDSLGTQVLNNDVRESQRPRRRARPGAQHARARQRPALATPAASS